MTFRENQTTDKHLILLSLGANLRNSIGNIHTAINYLKNSSNIFSMQVSSIYKTEPVGYRQQPWFINVVVSCFTDLSVNELFDFCQKIEAQIGRIKRERWHEREIDIDILLYGNVQIRGKSITIPHPEMHLRKFVLAPAVEIASDILHPGFNLTIQQLLEQCKDESMVIKYKPYY